jgi:quinoprotein glucose dehydrogenase
MPARVLKSIDRSAAGEFLHGLIIRTYEALFYSPPTLRLDITADDLKSIYETIRQVDDKIENGAGMTIKTFFQVLLDPDGLPGSNPPWGLISAIDLDSGLIAWSRPFGEVYDNATARHYEGDRNFGGALITGAGLIFATGTTDEFARAFLLKSGQELWKAKLPAAGSAPPMTYSYGNCQYVLFTASGGKFVGFKGRSDATVAYRLKNCAAS